MASGVGGRWVVGWEEREKGGTEQGGMGEVAWLRGEEKFALKKVCGPKKKKKA